MTTTTNDKPAPLPTHEEARKLREDQLSESGSESDVHSSTDRDPVRPFTTVTANGTVIVNH